MRASKIFGVPKTSMRYKKKIMNCHERNIYITYIYIHIYIYIYMNNIYIYIHAYFCFVIGALQGAQS